MNKPGMLRSRFRQSRRTERRRPKSLTVQSLESREMLAAEAITLADPSFYGVSGADESGNHSTFSADGQLIAFESKAGNLTDNDFNGEQDIFVLDRSTGSITLASATPEGVSGNVRSYNPILSADGRYVLFESDAFNLFPGDNNNRPDVFVRDLQTGSTQLVSVNLGGTGGGDGYNQAQAIAQMVAWSPS